MRTAETRGVAWAFWAHAEGLRSAQGLTVAELCRRADIRRQTYSDLRRTTRRPQSYIVLSIANVIAMDTHKALALAGLSPTDSDTVREAIARACDLNPTQKQSLLALLDTYDREEELTRTPRVPPPTPLFQAPAVA